MVTIEALAFIPVVNQGTGRVEIGVRVEASDTCTSHVPIDLVAVLACGSGMKGGATEPSSVYKKPTKLDLLRRAMNIIVKQLRDGDSLAVVVGQSSTRLLKVSASTRELVEKEVDELMTTKGAAPLKQAVELLDGRSDKDRSERLGFIVLVSDGGDGPLMRQEVDWYKSNCPDDGKYAVHTFGLGAAHDPKLLFSLAQESGGTYSFVRDGNLGDIIPALGLCLGGLKSVVAVDTRIRVEITSGTACIKEIQHGDAFKQVNKGTCSWCSKVSSAEVVVATLYAGEAKSFKVEIEHGKCSSKEDSLVITACGEYKHPPASAKPIVISARPVSIRKPGQAIHNSRVAKLRAQIKVIQMMDEFRVKVIDGLNHNIIAAGTKIDDAHRSAADELRNRWKKLMKPGEALDLACKGDHKRHVEDLKRDITAIADDLEKGQAAYFYSWLSSYSMKRATTVGSPHQPAAMWGFMTEKMKDELEPWRKPGSDCSK
ncbi:unnamed protein product [Urochloa humidicola]